MKKFQKICKIFLFVWFLLFWRNFDFGKLYFQLTKESRHALQAGEHINKPTLAQEYAILDKAATASESYLKGRLKTYEDQLSEIHKATDEKDNENQVLQHQIKELEAQLQKERGKF